MATFYTCKTTAWHKASSQDQDHKYKDQDKGQTPKNQDQYLQKVVSNGLKILTVLRITSLKNDQYLIEL